MERRGPARGRRPLAHRGRPRVRPAAPPVRAVAGAALFVHFYRLLCDLEPLAFWAISARLADRADSGFIAEVDGVSAKVRSALDGRREPPIHRVLVHRDNEVEARQSAVAVGVDANRVHRASSLDDVLDQVRQQHNARMEEMVPVRTHLTEKVREFLAAYLGGDERRVPFGGRGDVLASLDAWREAPGDDSFRLVVAPAGRGKSAALARWYDSLLRQGVRGEHVAYVPVSIRFSTQGTGDVLRLVADRLDVAVDVEINRDEPRDRITNALLRLAGMNQQVLVILDGLDEAQDREAFRNLLPPTGRTNLRVAAAVRSSRLEAGAWLDLLGWRDGPGRVIELERISAEGIGEVLRSMGRPLDRLGGRREWLDKLAELTEGDPLILELYVLQLWEAGPDARTPDSLRDMRPGLGAYFERWWDQQKALRSRLAPLGFQKAAMDALRVLATAHGPLGFAELRTLLRHKVDTDELTEILQHLDRFVRAVPRGVGGLRDYTLHHPRFRDFFLCQEGEHADSPRVIQVDAAEKAELRDRFVAWGQRELDRLEAGTLAPEAVPPYLVRHLGRHLEESGADIEQKMRLVSQRWNRACEALDGGGQVSFLRDLEMAWGAVRRQNDADVAAGATRLRYLAEEVHCWMIRSGIRGSSLADHPRLVVELVRDERMTIAEAMRCMAEMGDRAAVKVIEGLAPVIGQRDRTWLAELERRAATLGSYEDRSHTLRAVAILMECAERRAALGKALEAARLVGSRGNRFGALAAVAALMDGDERRDALAEVLAAARRCKIHGLRCRELVNVAVLMDGDERRDALAEAIAAARLEEDHEVGTSGLVAAATLMGGGERRAALAEAIEAAQRVGNNVVCSEALVAAAAALADGDERRSALGEAIEAARRVEGHADRSRALLEVAALMEGSERRDALAEAIEAARRVEVHAYRSRELVEVAARMEGSERRDALKEAIEAARRVEGHADRSRALLEVAARMDGGERRAALKEALEAARRVEGHAYRTRELVNVAVLMDGDERRAALAEALAAARRVGGQAHRSLALVKVAARMDGGERRSVLVGAIAAARLEEDHEFRSRGMVAAAALMDGGERRDALGEALAAVQRLGNHANRSRGMVAAAALMDGGERRDALAEALADARREGGHGIRSRALAAAATLMEGGERRNTLAEALADARREEGHWARSRALVAVAALMDGGERRDALAEALEAAQRVGNDANRTRALVAAATLMGAGERRDVLAEALEVARREVDYAYRSRALAAAATLMEGGERRNTLAEAIEAIQHAEVHEVVARLAHLYTETLETVQLVERHTDRSEALVAVARASHGLAIKGLLPSWPILSGILRYDLRLAGAWQVIADLLPSLFPFGAPDFPSRLARVLRDIQARWPD